MAHSVSPVSKSRNGAAAEEPNHFKSILKNYGYEEIRPSVAQLIGDKILSKQATARIRSTISVQDPRTTKLAKVELRLSRALLEKSTNIGTGKFVFVPTVNGKTAKQQRFKFLQRN